MIQRISNHKRRFGLWVSSAIVVLGTFFGLVLILQLKDQLLRNTVQEVGKQEILLAQEIADILDTRITNLQERLTLLTSISQIRNGDAVACNKKLKEVFAAMESKVDNLSRVSADGAYYCVIDPTRIGRRPVQPGDFLKQIFADPEHKPILSRATQVPGSDKLEVSLYVPVYDEAGVFAGTLGGSVSIEGFPQKYLSGLALVERGYVIIMDDNGDVLYHPEANYVGQNYWTAGALRAARSQELDDMVTAARADKSGTGTYGGTGEQRIAAYTAAHVFPGRLWLVLATVPVQEIEVILDKSGFQNTFLWIGLTVGAVLFLIPVFVFFYLVLPSLDERRHAHELADSKGLFEVERIRLEKETKQLKRKLAKLIQK